MSYWDRFNLLGLYSKNPYADSEDNSVEFSVILDQLTDIWNDKKTDEFSPSYLRKVHIIEDKDVEQLKQFKDGEYYAQRVDKPLDPASHDNMTAIMSWSRKNKKNLHKQMKIFPRYLHPRDIIYYAWMRRNWYDLWSFFMLPILMLILIQSCLPSHKKLDTGEVVIATDGEILTFLRCYYHMPITWWICHKILMKRFGKYCMHEIFKIYFKDENHPIRESSKGLI